MRSAALAVAGMALPLVAAASLKRDLSYEDLVEVVDIGVSASMDFDGVAVSPNGRFVAFETSRASLKRNAIEVRWRALELTSPPKLIDLGSGGEPIPAISSAAPQPVGVRLAQRPIWSRDSRWLFFRQRFKGSTQLWRVRVDGGAREQLTHHATDVEQFVLSNDGKHLLYETSTPDAGRAAQAASEAARGYLYDERFSTLLGTTPVEAQRVARMSAVWSYELESGQERAANAKEQQEFQSRTKVEGPENKRWQRSNARGGAAAWLESIAGPLDVERPLRIWAQHSSAHGPVPCRSEQCQGYFKGLWLDSVEPTVYFLRPLNGRDYGALALYAWRIGAAEPEEIFRTEDLLQACSPSNAHLICVRESAVRPAHLVRINLKTGECEPLYDPNPNFTRFRFGEVASLTWKDSGEVDGFGHLVKPVGYQPRVRYPLVIVQYRSRGFLRGGVGDEYPIHILAASGFAVLSFHRPTDWEVIEKFDTEAQRERALWQGQRDRRLVLSVLRASIERLDQLGIIDPARVGISGLSDGANTATYALIHAPREFAAAAVAGTYWNPIVYYLAGPLFRSRLELFDLGFPESEAGREEWRQLSMGMNASRIETPLLIQVSDAELLPETQTVAALAHYGKAVEMHVFPGEYHIKAQPWHRLNAYRRGVQWFSFWLRGAQDSDPAQANEYKRWSRMAAE